MRLSASLPENLWPETTLAAIHLFNMSPSYSHDWRTPNETLDSWFRSYFRWYDPELITRLTVDLKPNWNGIYVYGARAYPMVKNREANRSRRAFKVQSRGHIGYLVGYYASNIYRIWVPVLDKVIVTRNVVFDENILYSSKAKEQLDGHSVAQARQIVEAIEEEEVQDAGSVLENIGIWNVEMPERTRNKLATLGGGTQEATKDSTEAPSLGIGHNSGVEESVSTAAKGTGLMTPEKTPEPESMAPARSTGDGRTELPRRLSSIGEEDE